MHLWSLSIFFLPRAPVNDPIQAIVVRLVGDYEGQDRPGDD
jgi:hypothetical protein